MTKQGCSAVTPFKQEGLRAALGMTLKILSASKWGRAAPFFYFDLNSGCGVNPGPGGAEEPGSPLVALDLLESHNGPVYAHFVDHDSIAAEGLKARLRQNGAAVVWNAPNDWVAREIPDLIKRRYRSSPEHAHGLVYCDPNGFKNQVPQRELSAVFERCVKMDFLLNVGCNGAFKRGGLPPLHVDEFRRIFRKRFWLVRRHSTSDPHQYAMFLGRNYDGGEWKRARWHKMESQEGRRIVAELTTTKGTA